MSSKNLLEYQYFGLRKVISGGQCGADFAGLATARVYHVETGGWAPKGWKTALGPRPILKTYGLMEHPSPEYSNRTITNILDSDATLIVASNPNSPGSALTRRQCANYAKPVFAIHPSKIDEVTPSELCDFLISNHVNVLNVAGNRDFEMTGIHFASTSDLLLRTFILLSDQKLIITRQ